MKDLTDGIMASYLIVQIVHDRTLNRLMILR